MADFKQLSNLHLASTPHTLMTNIYNLLSCETTNYMRLCHIFFYIQDNLNILEIPYYRPIQQASKQHSKEVQPGISFL